MPRPCRIQFKGAKYHVTQRGNGGMDVFLCDDGRERFMEQLDHCLEKNMVKLYAYCLMDNHYHLLVETPHGNIQRFMQRLNTAYAMYFRYKHSKPGHCWQGRYGAKLVSGDDYILRLTRYIHLNPIKTGVWKNSLAPARLKELRGYEWSSCRGYAGLRKPEKRIDYRWLKLVSGNSTAKRRMAYRKYIESMACADDEEFLLDMQASRYAIGDEEFREEIEEELEEKKRERDETGDVEWPESESPEIEAIEAAVMKEFRVSREDLHFHGQRAGMAKTVAIELCCRLSGKSQREVGKYFGYTTDSGACQQRRKLAFMQEKDHDLLVRVSKVAHGISICKKQV